MTRLLLAAIVVYCAVSMAGAQQTAFIGLLTPTNTTTQAAPSVCQGTNPAKIVISSVVPAPAPGQLASVTLRNVGGQTANLTGFLLAGSNVNKDDPSAQVLTIGDSATCAENATIDPGNQVAFYPKSDDNPCGFEFPLSADNGSVQLADTSNSRVAAVGWQNATAGSQVLLLPDGSYKTLPPGVNVLDTLRALGGYTVFLRALQATGLDTAIAAASDPNYKQPDNPALTNTAAVELPWWFSGATAAPPPPPVDDENTPRPVGVPASGPYTILAPTDAAFDALLSNLGGGRRLPREALYRLPQLKDIITYHIVPGLYTPDFFVNNTAIWTAKGVEVVPFADGCMTGGSLMLHDSCVNKPTPDNFTCYDQVMFGKCNFPFIASALAAQWQGGFCQRTCQRCSCGPDSGISCAVVDPIGAQASNGIIYGLSRVLFPPPKFNKQDAIAQAAAYNASLAANISLGLALPGTGMADMTAIGATPTQPLLPAGVAPAGGAAVGAVPADATATGATPVATPDTNTTVTGEPAVNASSQSGRRRRLFLW